MMFDALLAKKLFLIVESGIVRMQVDQAAFEAESFALEGELPAELNTLLFEFSSTRNLECLWSIAMQLADAMRLTVEDQTRLIALLYKEKRLNANNSLSKLYFDSQPSSPQIRKVQDVCWLLQEDKNLGFLQPDHDDLLGQALASVR